MKKFVLTLLVSFGFNFCYPAEYDNFEKFINSCEVTLSGISLLNYKDLEANKRISNRDYYEMGRCIGYIDAMTEVTAILTKEENSFCLPEETTHIDIIKVILKNKTKVAGIAKKFTSFAIFKILKEHYPCKKTNKN